MLDYLIRAGAIVTPGCLARLVNGAMVRRNDTDTGARPGHLLRSHAKEIAA